MKPHRLSQDFETFSREWKTGDLTFGELIRIFELRGHALATLFLSVPFMLPIPMPGLSILLGSMICLSGIRMGMGLPVWFPDRWKSKRISSKLAKSVFTGGAKLLKKIERFTKPRGGYLHSPPWVRGLNGFMISSLGIMLALPLPPGTNFPPAIAIILLSVGTLEEDGVMIAFGYFAFAVNIAFFTLLGILGVEGVKALLKMA